MPDMPIERAVEFVTELASNDRLADLYDDERQALTTLLARNAALEAEVERLRTGLNNLYPGLVFDLRIAQQNPDEDTDLDCLQSRVRTIEEALAPQPDRGEG